MIQTALDRLDPQHRAALQWFAGSAALDVSWPAPLGGMFLVNKAKGIHKPKGLEYALSVRQSLTGPYEDAVHWSPNGSWSFEYAQEGANPEYFTNRALRACIRDKVPVGVLIQVREKPNARYRVLGLGDVVGEDEGVFTIRQFGSGAQRAEAAVDVSLPRDAFDASNLDDARRREIRSIAIRRGQPAFRRAIVSAYGGRCAVTGCTASAVLEAAHIVPYLGTHTNHVQNGVLLRADIHTLFDLGLIVIDPESYVVRVSADLRGTEFDELEGVRIRLPADKVLWPDKEALRWRGTMG